MNTITSSGAVQLPWPKSCPQRTIAVNLSPGGKVNRRLRRQFDRFPFAYTIIEGDPFGAARSGFVPADFDAASLAWAVRTASLVVLWGAGVPHDRDGFQRALEAHAHAGSRIALLLIRNDDLEEWALFAAKHTRSETELLAVTSTPTAGAVTAPTSGAIH